MEKEKPMVEFVPPSEKEAKGVAGYYASKEKDIFEVRYDGKPAEEARPDMEFYWGPTRSDRLEQEKWRRGFEVCKDPKIQTLHGKPDGSHQAGDAILLWRKREIGDEERKRLEAIKRAHLKKDRQEFRELARRQGIKTFEED